MAPPDPNKKEPVELDGRTLEGGGQLIRIALCLSALTGIPVKITDIRGNRSGGGGLKAQHLACVNWLAHASNAYVEGAEKGSKTLLFRPGECKAGELSPAFERKTLEDGQQVYEAKLEIGTAGSTGLASQAILPFILFSRFPSPLPVHLTLNGGTNVSGSPSYEYITHVLLPTLHNIGLPKMTTTLHKRGWSQGGTTSGSFTLEIPPRKTTVLPAFIHAPETTSTSPPPKPSHIRAIFLAPTSIHNQCRNDLPKALSKHPFLSLDLSQIEITTESSLSEKRLYLLLIASYPNSTHTLAADHLYLQKIRSLDRATTKTIQSTVSSLVNEIASGTYVDEHLRDQLIIFQAMAKGKCVVYAGHEDGGEGEVREPSLHARTAEWVCRRMLGVRFDAEGVCEGIGFGVGEEEQDVVEEVVKGVEGVSLG